MRAVTETDVVKAFLCQRNVFIMYTSLYRRYQDMTPPVDEIALEMARFIESRISKVKRAWLSRPKDLIARLNVMCIESTVWVDYFSSRIDDEGPVYSTEIIPSIPSARTILDIPSIPSTRTVLDVSLIPPVLEVPLIPSVRTVPDIPSIPSVRTVLDFSSIPSARTVLDVSLIPPVLDIPSIPPKKYAEYQVPFTVKSDARNKNVFPYCNEYQIEIPWTSILRNATGGRDLDHITVELETITTTEPLSYLSPFHNQLHFAEDAGDPITVTLPWDRIHSGSALVKALQTQMNEVSTRYTYSVTIEDDSLVSIKQRSRFGRPQGSLHLYCGTKTSIADVLGFQRVTYRGQTRYTASKPVHGYHVPTQVRYRIKEWGMDVETKDPASSLNYESQHTFKVPWSGDVKATYKPDTVTISTSSPDNSPVHFEHSFHFVAHVRTVEPDVPVASKPRRKLAPVTV
ncbi:hypothetical protein GGF32_002707 [Allomyces javanicus]|nr:hypothetical protein GGF32_002707 [Allomyces javanicus]